MATLLGFLIRLSILVIGVFWGVALFMPMGMLSDSGTTMAVTVSTIGVFGCIFLLTGGIIGAITKRWIALVPGTVLAVAAMTPALPPLAIVIIMLLYCFYSNYKPKRKNDQEELDEGDVDCIPVIQLPEEPFKDEKNRYDMV
jgi:hypothetical protein